MIRIIVLLVLLLQAAVLSAQVTPVDRLEDTQRRRDIQQSTPPRWKGGDTVPALYDGETNDIGPQVVLQTRQRRTYIEATVDAQYFYTDNMFYQDDNLQETMVLVPMGSFALAPTPYDLGPGRFGPRIGYRHQWFLYGLHEENRELDQFNFNAQTVFGEGRYFLGDHLNFHGGFEWTRLLSSHDYKQFYHEYVPYWGVQKLLPVTEQSLFSFSYDGRYHSSRINADPPPFTSFPPANALNRVNHIFTASYFHAFTEQLVAQPIYRFQFTDFTGDVDREDHLHSIGLILHYAFCPWASIRAFATYDIKQSSLTGVPDYRKFDAGGGLNLSFRF